MNTKLNGMLLVLFFFWLAVAFCTSSSGKNNLREWKNVSNGLIRW